MTFPRPLRRPRTVSLAVVSALAGLALVAPTTPAFAAPPTNDNFVNAQVIPGMGDNNSYFFANDTEATKEPGEPNHAGNAGGASVWYSWTAPMDADVRVYSYFDDPSTNNSLSHELAVYTGNSVSSLTAVTSQAARYPFLAFHATAGVTYHVAVDRAKKSPGGYINLNFAATADNDNFSAAQTIDGASGSTTGSNANASQEPGEPDHAGQPGGESVWYSWTAPESGTFDFDTHGSDFDTLLGVYTGSSVNGLSEVASNDDCVEDADQTSCVEFSAISGRNYRIAVDGYNFHSGAIDLNWSRNLHCTVTGTSSDDTLVGTSGDDVICGLGGDDVLQGLGGNDTLIGGEGTDTADFSTGAAGVAVDLRTGTATGQGSDTLVGIENLIGTASSDKLDGDDGPNVLSGGDGSDALWGHDGADTLQGGIDPDTIGGGGGDDIIDGGAGADTVAYGYMTTPVTVNLGAGTTTGDGSDQLISMENIIGGRSNDLLTGSVGNNAIQAGLGNDKLYGLGGSDQLYGSAGTDYLEGGAGVDKCDGGTQTDSAKTCENLTNVP